MRGVGCGVVDEELAVGFELRVEAESEQAFFVLFVFVDDIRADIEKDFRLPLAAFGQDVEHAPLHGHESTAAAVAGVREHDGPQGLRFSLLGDGLPAGPFHIGECQFGLDGKRRGFYLGERSRRQRCQGDRQCKNSAEHGSLFRMREESKQCCLICDTRIVTRRQSIGRNIGGFCFAVRRPPPHATTNRFRSTSASGSLTRISNRLFVSRCHRCSDLSCAVSSWSCWRS